MIGARIRGWRSWRERGFLSRRGPKSLLQTPLGFVVIAALALPLVSCQAQAAGSTNQSLTTVTVGMGYIPNVQFAPFYVAQARGYFRQAGLNVRLRYGIEPDLLRLATSGKVDFVNAGGDEVLAAGAQGLGVRYVMAQYTHFPAALFSLSGTGITSLHDLRGKSIGVPGKYGASYVGLLALLDNAHVPQSAVTIKTIGFTQAASVQEHKVDAAMGYATNEPIMLRQRGTSVHELDVYRWASIAGAGIATSDTEIARHPDVVRRFVAATVKGLSYTLSHPDGAFQIAEKAVPDIKAQAQVQRAVLKRTLDFWQPVAGHPVGWIDPQVWNETARLLYRYKQISKPVTAGKLYTNKFVPR